MSVCSSGMGGVCEYAYGGVYFTTSPALNYNKEAHHIFLDPFLLFELILVNFGYPKVQMSCLSSFHNCVYCTLELFSYLAITTTYFLSNNHKRDFV